MNPLDPIEEAIFSAASALTTPSQRTAFLDQACGGNAVLRQRIEALLQADVRADQFFAVDPLELGAETAEQTVRPETPLTEAAGTRVGRYKLLQKIGEGGMGVVYMAEQEEPVRRRVALKIIKLGMDTRQVIARFEAERQALALMDHPNIARVFDGGATETGRPYFVMELVQGVPITEFCDQNRLPAKERLKLFIAVCQAIQSAHQKGIIHRDIKPSNVLVTLHDGVPVPKVIDFGIAKATNQKLTEKTLFTHFASMIGTPAYMSPEQAEMTGLDTDTRTDIYALGVLLYALLTGTTPFPEKRLRSLGYGEMQRVIQEEEPERPSTRLSTMAHEQKTIIARNCGEELTSLSHLLKGDLDWIVMKCLEKDRQRRYETANGLAADITRHLTNDPVQARPPSRIYKFRKAIRRNKLVYTAAAAVALTLVIGVIGSALQAVRATRAEQLAAKRLAESEKAREESDAISKFLGEIFQSPDPAKGRSVTASEILAVAAKKLETGLATQPERRARLQATLGDTYLALGLGREAVPLHQSARDYYLTASGPGHTNTIKAMLALAGSYGAAGREEESNKLVEEAWALSRKVNGVEHPLTIKAMDYVAAMYTYSGRRAEAGKLFEEVLALSRKVNGPEHPDTLSYLQDQLGYMLILEKELPKEALRLQEEALALSRKINGPEHAETIRGMLGLAQIYYRIQRRAEAIELTEEALALSRKLNGPDHPDTINTMIGLAAIYEEAGRSAEALTLFEESVALSRKASSFENPATIRGMDSLAKAYSHAGRHLEAQKLLEEALALARKTQAPDDPQTLRVVERLGVSCLALGRADEALTWWDEASAKKPADAFTALKLGAVQAWLGKESDQAATCRRVLQCATNIEVAHEAEQIARLISLRPGLDAPQKEAALTLARRAVEQGQTNQWLPYFNMTLGMAEYRSGDYSAADGALLTAVQSPWTFDPAYRPALLGTAGFYRAMSLFRQGREAEGRQVFHEAVAGMKPFAEGAKKSLPDGATHDDLISWLAYIEAKALLHEAGTGKP